MHTPSITDDTKFEPVKSSSDKESSQLVEERDATELDANQATVLGKKSLPRLELLTPESVEKIGKISSSAKSHIYGANKVSSENPFLIVDAEQTSTVKSMTESQETIPEKQSYKSLADFTKENLINYDADGKTESVEGE